MRFRVRDLRGFVNLENSDLFSEGVVDAVELA